jgi:methionine salvage enolase-phosphatase E1
VPQILQTVSPHISKDDANHMHRILTQGCPSKLVLSESNEMKFNMIAQGNQQTFHMYPEVVTKTMNKEKKTLTLFQLSSGSCTAHLMHEVRRKACKSSLKKNRE